jgi:hypothetical protein
VSHPGMERLLESGADKRVGMPGGDQGGGRGEELGLGIARQVEKGCADDSRVAGQDGSERVVARSRDLPVKVSTDVSGSAASLRYVPG